VGVRRLIILAMIGTRVYAQFFSSGVSGVGIGSSSRCLLGRDCNR